MTQADAGRLYDRINNQFGDGVKVFMEVDSIGLARIS
jgi:hypothetical protein